MKILVIGAGVVGTTYSYQLNLAGHDLTHLIRKEKAKEYEKHGIPLDIIDKRKRGNQSIQAVYKPKIIDSIEPGHDFNVIIISVRSEQLDGAARILKDVKGDAALLFLQNISPDDLGTIQNVLGPDHFIVGFPNAGGGRKDNIKIEAVLENRSIKLGNINGTVSQEILNVNSMFKKAGLKSKITKKITENIYSIKTREYTMLALLGAFLAAGSYEEFAKAEAIKKFVRAEREILEAYKKDGIDIKKRLETRIFNYPLWLIVFLLRLIVKSKMGKRLLGAFEAEILKNDDWFALRKINYKEALDFGRKYNVEMPCFSSFKPYMEKSYKYKK